MRAVIRTVLALALAGVIVAPAAGPALADGGFAQVGSSVGSWESLVRDSRSEALGGADLAVASGPFATLTNAAPIRGSDGVEVAAGWFEYSFGADIQQAGVSAQTGSWRFAAIAARWQMDPILVRTAYNPEGTGEIFELKQDFVLFNLAYDLSSVPMLRLMPIDWTVGAGLRHHRYEMDISDTTSFVNLVQDTEYDGWDTDLGLTGRWSKDLTGGYAEITGSVLLRNAFDSHVTIGESEASLPRFRNFGMAAAVGLDVFGTDRNDLRIAMMLASRKNLNLDDDGFFGDGSVGMEITLLDAASLRIGTDNYRNYADEGSWGLGLALPARVSSRFVARYDYTRLDGNPDFIDLDRDQHTITAGVRF